MRWRFREELDARKTAVVEARAATAAAPRRSEQGGPRSMPEVGGRGGKNFILPRSPNNSEGGGGHARQGDKTAAERRDLDAARISCCSPDALERSPLLVGIILTKDLFGGIQQLGGRRSNQ